MAGDVLVVDDGLDDDQVLGGDQAHGLALENAFAGTGEHLVVEEDAAGGPEDDVDHDVVLEGLEQPVGIGLLGGEAGPGQRLQHPVGVLGTDEEVDVVGPPGPAHGGRADPAHEQVVDLLGIQGGAGVTQDGDEAILGLHDG